jgi:peptidoglycan/LPS O-acetylase OafA/YrhL
MPFLAAGAIAITGGVAREHGWPKEGLRALVATIILVVLTSATADTKIAPLVRAIGLLTVMIAIIAAVPAFNTPTSKKGK